MPSIIPVKINVRNDIFLCSKDPGMGLDFRVPHLSDRRGTSIYAQGTA